MISGIIVLLLLLPSRTLSQTTHSGQPNQHAKCHTDDDAWPKLWLDVVLLIDNSAAQTQTNFDAMLEQIGEIWQAGAGGPIVSQATAKTRVAVVTFDTHARVVANLDELHSNTDLTNVLRGLRQTTSLTVDGSNALSAAGALFAPNARGNRPNVPNVIIILTADWAGNDACQIAESIHESAIILAVTFENRHQDAPTIPACVYSPDELYTAKNPDLDVIMLTSLSLANCFCVGQVLSRNHVGSLPQKVSRASHQVWDQFWLPRADKKYYLRDKWAECVQESTTASSNHDTALNECHANKNYLPNEFSLEKHQFLIDVANGKLVTQWIGLQYDSMNKQWFWDNYDRIMNQTIRTPVRFQ
uniref:VWFA domain-containing protein n=1 Tax=Plectus sambesii TaxID=2011161 RepID=A0A914WA24_9BILA